MRDQVGTNRVVDPHHSDDHIGASAMDPTLRDAVQVAARICHSPISLVTVITEDWQYFLAAEGTDQTGSPLEASFCRDAIRDPGRTMVVPDLSRDERYADNPIVAGEANIRFYAGAPLSNRDGVSFGTLCVLDRVPRVLSSEMLEALRCLADQVTLHLETTQLQQRLKALHGTEWTAEEVVHEATGGLVIWDRMGTVVQASDGFAELCGASAASLLRQPISTLFLDQALLVGEGVLDPETRIIVPTTVMRRMDGRIRWVRAVTTVRGDSGLRLTQVTHLPDPASPVAVEARPVAQADGALADLEDLVEDVATPAEVRIATLVGRAAAVTGWALAHVHIFADSEGLDSVEYWHVDESMSSLLDDGAPVTERQVMGPDPLTRDMVRLCFDTGEAVLHQNLLAYAPSLRRTGIGLPLRRACAVPIRHRGRVLGVLELLDIHETVMTARDLKVLSHAGDLIGRLGAEARGRMADRQTGLASKEGFAAWVSRLVPAGAVNLAVIGIDRDDTADDDDIWTMVAAEMTAVARPDEVLGRIAPTVFAIVSTGDNLPAGIVDRMLVALGGVAPATDMTRLRFHAGILSSNFLQHEDVEYAVDATVAAMHMARERGVQVEHASEQGLRRTTRARQLRGDLIGVEDRGELSVYLQPIVDLRDGRVAGYEALSRWHHPVHGDVTPGEFIPWAEESGDIAAIGRWVLTESCRLLAEAGVGDQATLSVNVSVCQLTDPQFLLTVENALAMTRLAPASLTLEITETALMRDPQTAVAALHALKERGVRLAVDDFGTGYSSLEYLQRMPLDRLKLDRAFVAPLPGKGQAIAQTILNLADTLGLELVAEGIETEAQRDWLMERGCGLGQGWLYAKATPAREGLTDIGRTLGARPKLGNRADNGGHDSAAAPALVQRRPDVRDATARYISDGPLKRLSAARLLLETADDELGGQAVFQAGLAAVRDVDMELQALVGNWAPGVSIDGMVRALRDSAAEINPSCTVTVAIDSASPAALQPLAGLLLQVADQLMCTIVQQPHGTLAALALIVYHDMVLLQVIDRGQDTWPTEGPRVSGLIQALQHVTDAAGSVKVQSGDRGTTVQVILPLPTSDHL